jgi:hypothetical protein
MYTSHVHLMSTLLSALMPVSLPHAYEWVVLGLVKVFGLGQVVG